MNAPKSYQSQDISRPFGWLLILVATLLPIFCIVSLAGASWTVDPARFHASAHGQISCLTCHEAVSDQAIHPDPRNMGRGDKAAFATQQCLYCHDGIMEGLEAGSHGSMKVDDPAEYEACIGCHNPHTQVRREDKRTGRFDPKKPVSAQCGSCHRAHTSLPPLPAEDRACMTCHGPMGGDTPQAIERVNTLCLHCHGQSGTAPQAITGQMVPLMDEASYDATPHGELACTACHRDAETGDHREQKPVACTRCHQRHPAKTAHDLHLGVSCQACHLEGGGRPVRDKTTHRIVWERDPASGNQSFVHEMIRYDDKTACRRCHYPGNALGAVAMTLPAKGVLCMPCHTSTFSVDDPITLVALIIFCLGLVLFFSFFLTGSLSGVESANPFSNLIRVWGRACRVLFSSKVLIILRSLFWDVLLQRRLFQRSRTRWVIHALIFWAFVFRFFWGLSALLGSLWDPGCQVVWDMADKNNPATAVFFDVTGIVLLLGVIFAFIRGTLNRRNRAPGLPQQDPVALGLIGGIVVVGFILEGMRIALTGYPDGAGYAFLGYGIGHLFSLPRGLTEVYGFTWYIHAVLTGVFIAYIPFSRLLHVIIAPIVLPMQAVSPHHPEADTATNRQKGEVNED